MAGRVEEAEEMQANNPSSNGLTLAWMDPYELAENPLNPRHHPQAQRRSLHAALESPGWLQALLYNQRTGRLIDGHLRRQEAIESGITEVPVLVVELDEASERAALASIDSITAQAEVDQGEYAHLLRTILEERDDLVKALAGKDEEFLAMFGGSAPGDQERPEVSAVHLVPGEQYHYVMLLFRTDLDWLSAIDHFQIDDPAIDLFHNSKVVGRTRVIDGARYLGRVLKDA